MSVYVDIPTTECISNADGPFKHIVTFATRKEAIAFCQEHFGADEQGRVSLVSGDEEEIDLAAAVVETFAALERERPAEPENSVSVNDVPEPDDDDLNEDDICPVTGKRHHPDWQSLTVEHDGETYLDVSCVNCGRSGCVGTTKTLGNDINW